MKKPIKRWLCVSKILVSIHILSALFLATVTGILAAAIPSRRAAALDPVEAIRHV